MGSTNHNNSDLDEVNKISNIGNEAQEKIDAGKKNLENIEAGIMSEGNHLSVDNVEDIPIPGNGLVNMAQNGENFLKIWENLVEGKVDFKSLGEKKVDNWVF
jgi:hypothetical protein